MRTLREDAPHGSLEKPRSRKGKRDSKPAVQAHQKPARGRNPEYLAWLHENVRVCQVPMRERGDCRGALEAAHVDVLGDKGLGSKSPDIFCVMLCSYHHRGPAGLDTVGQNMFSMTSGASLQRRVLENIALWEKTR